MQRIDLHHALADGTADVVVDNPWGDVYVRRNPKREVYVHAVAQQLGEPAARADVRLDGRADNARLRVRFAGAGADCRRERAGGGRYGRVDLSVFVPVDVRLRVRSACDGRVDVAHVIGDLDVRTDAGEIRASASGNARIRSEAGNIQAFLQAESARPSEVRSRGGIVLTMPPAVRASVEAYACGGLRSLGFDWQSHSTRDGCEQASAVFNSAESRVRVASLGSFVDLRLRGTARQ